MVITRSCRPTQQEKKEPATSRDVMSTKTRPNSLWLLFTIAAVTLFTLLGWRGLNEPDEGRYAEIGREMAVSGNWLVPQLNGFMHFQKPPLIAWATAGAIRLFGANEWAVRLPCALPALATVMLTAWMGAALFGERRAFLAGLVLLSSAEFFILARMLTPDMMLTFWITLALACFVQYAHCRRGRRWVFLFFAAIGFGFLTKGPMALVVPISAAVAWQLAQKRQADSLSVPWFFGMALALGIGLSWFVALSCWRHELFEYFWRYELLERFASHVHGRSRPFWFFLPIILGALMPWTLLLPGAARQSWRRLREHTLPLPGWLLLGWIVPPFVMLSFSGSKLPTYILPLLPAFALGLAVYATRGGRAAIWMERLAYGTQVSGLIILLAMPSLNDRLGQQASLRDLIRPVANPAFAQARFCAVEVSAHGLEFYLQRLVTATREQSDLLVPPTPEQERRLISTKKFDAEKLRPSAGDPPVLALVRRERAALSFPKQDWRELGRAGDFVLLQAQAKPAAAAILPH